MKGLPTRKVFKRKAVLAISRRTGINVSRDGEVVTELRNSGAEKSITIMLDRFPDPSSKVVVGGEGKPVAFTEASRNLQRYLSTRGWTNVCVQSTQFVLCDGALHE